MKKTIIILCTLFFSALILGLGSCKPKDKLETPFTRLTGKWKEAKFATDDNANGVIDPQEIQNVPTEINDVITFNSDSTGVETTNSSPSLSFKWRIVSGVEVLVQYRANDTTVYDISEVTSVDLTLTTTTSQGLAWYYYIRQ